jgi:hypothetical protein
VKCVSPFLVTVSLPIVGCAGFRVNALRTTGRAEQAVVSGCSSVAGLISNARVSQ